MKAMTTFFILTALIVLFIVSPIAILAWRRAREGAHPTEPGMATQQRLTRLIMQLFERWDVDKPAVLALLGMKDDRQVPLQDYRHGSKALPDDPATLDRIAHLLAIDHALECLHQHNPDMRYSWIHLPNHELDGSSPLTIMTRDAAGLARIARLAESRVTS